MPDLSPAPSSLGLTSPALGPWFERSATNETDLPPMPLPGPDLSVTLPLPAGAIWNAPAGGTLSYLVATPIRPPALASLRQADGSPAFADDTLILLFTLMPEVAERLGHLAQAAPRPDSTATPEPGTQTRPIITHLAMEVPAPATIADLGALLPAHDLADLKTLFNAAAPDANATPEETEAAQTKQLALLGLALSGGTITNGKTPATILRRPEMDDRRVLETTAALPTAKLWAFTRGGRPYDPGALARLWRHLGEEDWDNLWASDQLLRQRTCDTEDSQLIHLVNAHQGPLEPHIKPRIAGEMTNLTAHNGSDILFTANDPQTNPPSIGFSAVADPSTDSAPVPRMAPLPAGPYRAPDESAAIFAGWAAPTGLDRDFTRIAITDIERLITGLSRDAGTPQADPRRRMTAAPNTAEPLFLHTSDRVATAAMDLFAAPGATVDVIAPELDQHWGPQPIPSLGPADPFQSQFDNPAFTAHSLIGSGQAVGDTAADQSIVLVFDETLPPDAWIRIWPHGRDLDTGRRYPMTGGAAFSDTTGSAHILVPLPNGTRGDGSEDVQISFDMSVSTAQATRLHVDRRAARPVIDTSAQPVDITALTATQSLFCPETATSPAPATGSIAPGHGLFVVTGTLSDQVFTALDHATLRPDDYSPALSNSADADDRLITRTPAFSQTPPGDLPENAQPGGPERVHNGAFHKASLGQEITDFALHDRSNNSGIIGSVSPRNDHHEAPPAHLGHPGASAAPEIHGEGIAVAGPAANLLRQVLSERRPESLSAFIASMGTPAPNIPDVTDPGPWTTLLETAYPGTVGHDLIDKLPDTVTPGLAWDNPAPATPGIKQRLDAVLATLPGGLTVDGLVDTANFDDDVAAAAFDRVLHKHKEGVRGFAQAALAAIDRAEDLIWIQTPSLDHETFTSAMGDIAVIQRLINRLVDNPALHIALSVPAKFLPDRDTKLASLRKTAIGSALQVLSTVAPTRVAWVTPAGGPNRPYHMASTTLIVDDTVMFSGSAHLWRRGLVFDSGLTAGIFDERLSQGRPNVVRASRRLLASMMLGVPENLVPASPHGLISAMNDLRKGGGYGRSQPTAFQLQPDTSTPEDRAIWNPARDTLSDLVPLIAGLTQDQQDSFETGTR